MNVLYIEAPVYFKRPIHIFIHEKTMIKFVKNFKHRNYESINTWIYKYTVMDIGEEEMVLAG